MKHRVIKVNFSQTEDPLALLAKVIKSYINSNGNQFNLTSEYIITTMEFHPAKGKNGRKLIKLQMEIGRP